MVAKLHYGQGDDELRRQGSNLPFAGNNRASFHWTTPDRLAEATADGFGRGRTCNLGFKRPLLFRLSYEAAM